MQNFAINGGVLNGDPQVWLDEVATAAVVLHGDGEVMQGLSLQGTAQTVVAAEGALAFRASLTGQAGVALSASGQVQRGGMLSGAAGVQMAATGDFTRWVMIEGDSPVEFFGDGDIQVVPGVSATFSVIMSAACDLRVGVGRKIEGYLPIVLRGDMRGYHVKATHLCGYADIELAALGHAALSIMSPPGVATIQLAGAGDLRFGEKIGLEGYAAIDFYSRGSVDVLHYVYAEGVATIEIEASAAMAGKPQIPTEYEPAPASRTISIGREARERSLARENRSIA